MGRLTIMCNRVRWHGLNWAFTHWSAFTTTAESGHRRTWHGGGLWRSSLVNYLNPLLVNDQITRRNGQADQSRTGRSFARQFYYCRILMKERSVLASHGIIDQRKNGRYTAETNHFVFSWWCNTFCMTMFSILVANYNNGSYFPECYESIMAQTTSRTGRWWS